MIDLTQHTTKSPTHERVPNPLSLLMDQAEQEEEKQREASRVAATRTEERPRLFQHD